MQKRRMSKSAASERRSHTCSQDCDVSHQYEMKETESCKLGPVDIKQALEVARLFELNPVVKAGLQLAQGFANYGLTFTADDPVALKKWWGKYQFQTKRFVREMWRDFLLMDNSVSFWRTNDNNKKILVVEPERCKYTDAMGLEKLWIKIDLSGMDSETMRTLPDRYRKGVIEVGDPGEQEAAGEEYSVLKRGRIGGGFSWPSIIGIQDDIVAYKAMRVADRNWALASRLVLRVYKLGHEIKNGPQAGSNKHFWKKERAAALRSYLEEKLEGIFDYTCNFDQAHEYPFPSADRWEAKKYEAATGHIHQWLGVVGMLMAGKNQDYLMKLMRAWATTEREIVQEHIVRSLKAFNPPAGLMPRWSDRIFVDDRLFLEAMRNLLAAGPLSQESALDALGMDVAEERRRKAIEAKLPKDQTKPLFDAAHGEDPTTAKPNGRPPSEGNAR